MAVLSWIEGHPGTAGWVQGIGSIVAVIVAIIIPVFLRRIDQKERKKENAIKSICLAIAIKPDLLRIISHADILIGWCNDPLNFRGEKRSFGSNSRFDVPEIMLNNIDKFYILGDDAGRAAQTVLAELQNHNQSVEAISFDSNGDRATWTAASAHNIANLALTAIDRLGSIVGDS